MADLPWFPYDCEAWERRVRALGLTFEGEGILHRLARRTWTEDRPCTIRDDPEELARILGPQWKRALPALREHFTPLADEPKVLRCEWLYEDYLRALKKHESYQTRGGLGGRPKKSDGAQIEAELKPGRKPQLKAELKPQLKAEVIPELSQSTTEGSSSPPTEERATTPPTGVARAPGGAALAVGTPLAAQAESIAEVGQSYGSMLHDAVDDWLERHPAQRAEVERDAARACGARSVDHIPVLRLSIYRGNVVELVRQRAKWPHERQWDGTPFGQPTEEEATR